MRKYWHRFAHGHWPLPMTFLFASGAMHLCHICYVEAGLSDERRMGGGPW